MNTLAVVALVISGVLVTSMLLALLSAWPLMALIRKRQAIEQERRLAEWRLQAVTSQTMHELLRQARRRP